MRCGPRRKVCYSTEDAAIRAAIRVDEEDAGHRPMNVYRCDEGTHYHIGHRPKVLAAPPPPVAPPVELVRRCDLKPCGKRATETVKTPAGVRDVCKDHGSQLRRVYGQGPES